MSDEERQFDLDTPADPASEPAHPPRPLRIVETISGVSPERLAEVECLAAEKAALNRHVDETLATRAPEKPPATTNEYITEGRLQELRLLQSEAMSEHTLRAYRLDWARFVKWCDERDIQCLPSDPLVVSRYLQEAAMLGKDDIATPYASNTFARWVAAIDKMNELGRYPRPSQDPELDLTLKALRRTNGGELRRVPALLIEELRVMVSTIGINSYPKGVIGTRDYALIVMGFAGAFRRSELAALTIGDVTLHETDGLHVRVRKSKTDQEARGRTKALPYGATAATCPVCAFMRWILVTEAMSSARARPTVMRALAANTIDAHICARGRDSDDPVDWGDPFPAWRRLPKRMPLFRPVSHAGRFFKDTAIDGQVVQDALVRTAKRAGMDSRHYGAHSLRAGFVTSALRKGLNPHQIMRQSWHTSEAMIEVYGREHAPLDNNAVTEIGL